MKISIFLVFGLLIVSTILGIGFGYYITPEYQSTMFERSNMDMGPADSTFDLRYTNAMISHHRGAMLLATKLAKNTKRPEMTSLAQNILDSEPKSIAQLYKLKKEMYGDNKKIRDPIVANLGSYDNKFDLRFINAMIAHHEIGINMTKETRQKSNRAEILNDADGVEIFLTNSIQALYELRKNWYKI